MALKDYAAQVLSNRPVAQDIYEMTLRVPELPQIAGAQFVNILLPTREHVLRRPFCICDCDRDAETVTVCYAVVGAGTRILSEIPSGQTLRAMLPLGNGYAPAAGSRIALVGGGMGSAVLPAVARCNPQCAFDAWIGFSDASKVGLEERLRSLCDSVTVTTDNGSAGRRGFVTDALDEALSNARYDAVFACGPEIMYRSLAKVAARHGVPAYVSLEQRMGCGIGACLVCNCKVKRNGEQGYARVCKDGPVFALEEIVL